MIGDRRAALLKPREILAGFQLAAEFDRRGVPAEGINDAHAEGE